MNPYIFREYDIRGIVETDFTPKVVIDLGRAFGTYVKRSGGKRISISGDIRLTTPRLMENFSQGLLETGINVLDLGIIPTPANYFSMFHFDVDGAVQITGSHNPPEFNGFKLSYKQGAFYGDQIQALLDLINTRNFETGGGKIEKVDIMKPYQLMLKEKIQLDKPMKAVIDCGNAAGCLTAPQIFKELGIETTELFCDIDGTFPNHHPDPTEDHNLVDLVNEIKSGEYDFGVAYDGDADRVVAVDENGGIIRSDILMALFLPEVINNPGDTIVFDVKCSQALEDMILKHGGKPVMWKTGHSLIKDKMKELDVNFAGEMSGHIFFADDFFGFDDAIYVSLRLAQLLSRTKQTLSELTSEVPVYYSTPEMRLECSDDKEKFNISKKADEYFTANYDCSTVDGVRIKFDDGWGLVRASNTQPVIVCRFEAKTSKRMEEIQNEILDKLSEFGEIALEHC
ncbi:MAG: phosphomannomutase/phosphoglucomutase [Candidatus Marinimicrobia bacterium]|nr:phosphomannomutase/phosphoglucomutase [Candidatus Neomarinimicrobiota bacterium]